MEMNTPVNLIAAPQVIEQPKQSNFLVILLSVLLFISVAIAGFFAYQTQKMVKELTLLRNSPTPIVTTESTTKPAATLDNVESWTTVINEEGFSFKYPPIEAALSIDFEFKDSDVSFDCLLKTKSETHFTNAQKLILDYYINSNKGICGSDGLNRLVANLPEYPPFIIYYKDSEKDLAISFLDTIVSTFKYNIN